MKHCKICTGTMESDFKLDSHSICTVRLKKGYRIVAINVPVLTNEENERFKIEQAEQLKLFTELGSRIK